MSVTESNRITRGVRRTVALVAAAVTIVLISGCNAGTKSPAGSSAAEASEPQRTPSAATSSSPGRPPSADPSRPTGPADSDDRKTVRFGHLQYEVPRDWDVVTNRTGSGQKVPISTYAKGFCENDPDSHLGTVLLTGNFETGDPVAAVKKEVRKASNAFFHGRSTQTKLGGLKHKGDTAVIVGRLELKASDDPCDGSSGAILVRAWTTKSNPSQCSVMLVVAELGHARSPEIQVLAEIINSLEAAD